MKRRNTLFAILSALMMVLIQPTTSMGEMPTIVPPKPSAAMMKSFQGVPGHRIPRANPHAHTVPVKESKTHGAKAPTKSTAKKAVSVTAKNSKSMAKKALLTTKTIKSKKPAQRKVAAGLSAARKKAIHHSFASGSAGSVSPRDMVRAGVFAYYPLRGGTFRRQMEIKAVVVHSTETASPATAKQIVQSWNNSGRNHAGTQYIIDRDGVIYQTADPTIGTFHVDSRITLEGVKNQNSIGIEIVRTGEQKYTNQQMQSIGRLVHYLTDRFNIDEVWGHGQIQPADRSDPVGFNWTAFGHNLKVLKASGARAQSLATSKKTPANAG